MILTRWRAATRDLSKAEVDACFTAHPDETLLFAFTADRMVVGEHAGGLSLKLVTHGIEYYRFGRRVVALEPGRLLVANAGQEYSSWIDRRTRSVSCFLPRSVLSGVPALEAAPTGDLASGEVAQVPFRPGPSLAATLAVLTAAVDALRPPPPDHLEEVVLEAAGLAVAEARGLALPGALRGCARPSTRDELLARIIRARDFAEERRGAVTLGGMAHAAGLSRYHFLRVFKAVCGVTPAAYARSVRVERGLVRLRCGDSSRVAARVAGFRSASSFLRSIRLRK